MSVVTPVVHRANVVMVDAADMLVGLDNWMLERATDLNIIWISKHVLEPVPAHLLPAPVVCITIEDKVAANFELMVRGARKLGSRVLVAAMFPTAELRARAAAAGVERVIDGAGSFTKILRVLREMLGLVQPERAVNATAKINGRRVRPFSAFEREVLRLSEAGLPPLLIGARLSQSYDMVKPVLDEVASMSEDELSQRLALV